MPTRVEATVDNPLGLHARPAMLLAQKAAEYSSQITIGRKDREDSVDAKSIMHLLMLAATQGTTLEITAEGPDEAEAAEALAELVRTRFEED
ncbi:MAG: HPr family phosphocarrier protein [Planctomycetota bacterium]|jgi:phosphocarrier protein|nr:HPr family phosphocarrier protein [Planctomycetota bacterium]MEC8385972.1 HPr family phosphocarrier protein [Planctomycetota bacterium]